MFVSIACYGLHIRTPQVPVPAFADSYLPAVTVSLKAGQSTYNELGVGAQRRRQQGIAIFGTFGDGFTEEMGLEKATSDVVQGVQEMV